MRQPRHLLILLGLICQGLVWDNWFLPTCYALMWVVTLRARPREVRNPQKWEAVLLAFGCVASFAMGGWLGRDTHFFLGHGLALVQGVRLLRPLNRREKLVTILVAMFHVAVACASIFDLRSIPILIAAAALLPLTWTELEAETYTTWAGQAARPGERWSASRRPRIPVWFLAALTIVAVGFFIAFPRGWLRSPMAMGMQRTNAGTDGDGTDMMDDLMDPTRGGRAQSSRVLFHVQGERLGYLRCYSLTETDGVTWWRPTKPPWSVIQTAPVRTLGQYLHRKVRVKRTTNLSRVLPVDGKVVFLTGRFFGRPMVNGHGGIETDSMWNTGQNEYDYWIDPNPRPQPLLPGLRRVYTRTPPASPKVKAWLDNTLQGASMPYTKAKRLESWLEYNLTYEIGAPDLRRMDAIEQFLFQEKRGHCERFAATLALLLRQIEIPSRVVIGFLPNSRNPLTGGFNIRAKDAHAWVEAWFENQGWVQLDPTPRSPGEIESRDLADFLADLDFAWSSYVASIDPGGQRELWSRIGQGIVSIPAALSRAGGAPAVVIAMVLFAILITLRNARTKKANHPSARVVVPPPSRSMPSWYKRYLQALTRLGYPRNPAETPDELHRRACSSAAQKALETDSHTLTEAFCASRYGGHPPDPAREIQLAQAASRVEHASQAGNAQPGSLT